MSAQPIHPSAGHDTGSELEDVEDATALQEWRAREAAGETAYLPADEVRRRLGLNG